MRYNCYFQLSSSAFDLSKILLLLLLIVCFDLLVESVDIIQTTSSDFDSNNIERKHLKSIIYSGNDQAEKAKSQKQKDKREKSSTDKDSLNDVKSDRLINIDSNLLNLLEQSFVRKMGLSQRPRPKRKIDIPQHFLDIYNEVTDSNAIFAQEMYGRYRKRRPYNTLRSFLPESVHYGKHIFYAFNVMHFYWLI